MWLSEGFVIETNAMPRFMNDYGEDFEETIPRLSPQFIEGTKTLASFTEQSNKA